MIIQHWLSNLLSGSNCQRRFKQRQRKTYRRPIQTSASMAYSVERLEDRVLLSVAPLVYDVPSDEAAFLTLRLDDVFGTDTFRVINDLDEDPVTQILAEMAVADTSEIQITGSDLGDQLSIDLSYHGSGVMVTFAGGDGDDVLIGPDDASLSSNWVLTANNAGTVEGVTFSSVEILTGGLGFDTLDYSGFATSGVTVDLEAGTAEGGFEVIDFEGIIGTTGADDLTGNASDNVLEGGNGDDTLSSGGGMDTVVERRDADFDLDNTELTIGIDPADELSRIEQAELTGGDLANVIDASDFTLGQVILIGGGGFDILVVQRDDHMTLTNTQLTFGDPVVTETDTISGFERAELTGGAAANAIDASGFSGLTEDTELTLLNRGAGVDRGGEHGSGRCGWCGHTHR